QSGLQEMAWTAMARHDDGCRGKKTGTVDRLGRLGTVSEITKRQVELDVAIVDRAAIHTGDAEEAYVERVLVGADLGYARQVRRQRESQQLRDLGRREHELEDAVIRGVPAQLSVLAQ